MLEPQAAQLLTSARVRRRPVGIRVVHARQSPTAESLLSGAGGWLALPFALLAPAVLILGSSLEFKLVLIGAMAFVSFSVAWEVSIGMMLGIGFFLGPLKIGQGGWAAYAIPELIVGLMLARWALNQVSKGQSLLGGTPVSTPFLCLVGYLALEVLNPNAPLLRTIAGLRSWLMYSTMLFVGYTIYRGPDQLERIYRVLIGLAVVTALYGIAQWQEGPSSLERLGGEYPSYSRRLGAAPDEATLGETVFRAPSSFMTANTFAGNMAYVALVALGPMASLSTPWLWRIAYALAMIVMGGAVAVSGSRGPIAYLLGSLVVVGLLFRKYREVALAVPVAFLSFRLAEAVTWGLMSPRFSTLWEPETYFWKWFSPLIGGIGIGTREILGRGLGYTAGLPQFLGTDFFAGLPGNTIDSGYGAVAAELGIPGLIVFTWFAVQLGIAGSRTWRHMPPGRERDLLLGPAIWATVFPVWTLIAQPHASLPASSYLWLLIGMLLKAGRLNAAQPAASIDFPKTPGANRLHRPTLSADQ